MNKDNTLAFFESLTEMSFTDMVVVVEGLQEVLIELERYYEVALIEDLAPTAIGLALDKWATKSLQKET